MEVYFKNKEERADFIARLSGANICPRDINIIDNEPWGCDSCRLCWEKALQQQEKEISLHKENFTVQRKTVLIHYILELGEKLPDDDILMTADKILADLTNNQDIWENGMATDIFNTWLSAESDKERSSIEGMFLVFAGIEFESFLDKCLWMITRTN